MMKIDGIHPPQLKIPSKRGTGQLWLAAQTAAHTLTITPETWDKVPMELFDCVVLEYCLNYAADIEDMRTMVSDAKDRLKPGGKVVALARGFDNGQELAERMARSGVADQGLSNLSNREVGMLSPLSAVILTHISVFRPSEFESDGCEGPLAWLQGETERFASWIRYVRKSARWADIRFAPEHLTTRITDVGLTWQK